MRGLNAAAAVALVAVVAACGSANGNRAGPGMCGRGRPNGAMDMLVITKPDVAPYDILVALEHRFARHCAKRGTFKGTMLVMRTPGTTKLARGTVPDYWRVADGRASEIGLYIPRRATRADVARVRAWLVSSPMVDKVKDPP